MTDVAYVRSHNPFTDASTSSVTDYNGEVAAMSAQEALWDSYKQAASDAFDAARAVYDVAGSWASTGQVESAYVVPVTPDPLVETVEDPGTFCGAARGRVGIGGNPRAITTYFFGKKIVATKTTTYRWVQDVEPVPPGTWGNTAFTQTASFPDASCNNLVAAKVNPLIPSILAIRGVDSSAVHAATGAFFASTGMSISGTCGSSPFDQASINLSQADGNTLLYTRGIREARFSITRGTVPAVLGQWHLEAKVDYSNITVTNRTPACKSSSYMSYVKPPAFDDFPGWDSPTIQARLTIIATKPEPDPSVAETSFRIYNWGGSNDDFVTVDETLPGSGAILPTIFDFTYPGASFLLQTGTPLAGYSPQKGSFVYDLLLKKWGKYRAVSDYQTLIDFSPINSVNSIISTTDNGINMGILDQNGDVFLVDSIPGESFMRFGKVGYYRLGRTNAYEVRFNFRHLCDCDIEIQGSSDGISVDPDLLYQISFSNVLTGIAYPDISAQWFVIKISGNYDLTGMEFRGKIASRR